MRILLIEDDPLLVTNLKESLGFQFQVDAAATASEGQYLAETNLYDVIALNLHLPDRSGLDLCHSWRQQATWTPVLMLTASTATAEKVRALDAGADDVLAKPFAVEELEARCRALHRRCLPSLIENRIEVGQLQLNLNTGQLTNHQQPIYLRKKEFLVLEFLLRRPGQVVTRHTLFDYGWGCNSASSLGTVDVHIKAVRDKVDKPFGTHYVQTVHGFGYKISHRG